MKQLQKFLLIATHKVATGAYFPKHQRIMGEFFANLVLKLTPPDPQKNVAIIGNDRLAQHLYRFFMNRKEYYNLKGVFVSEHTLASNSFTENSGSLSDLKEMCKQNQIDEIYCTLLVKNEELLVLKDFANNNNIPFRLAQNKESGSMSGLNAFYYEDIPAISAIK